MRAAHLALKLCRRCCHDLPAAWVTNMTRLVEYLQRIGRRASRTCPASSAEAAGLPPPATRSGLPPAGQDWPAEDGDTVTPVVA